MAPGGGLIMDLFGTKFTIALGAWKLRFVLMLEDDEPSVTPRPTVIPHHVNYTSRMSSHVR